MIQEKIKKTNKKSKIFVFISLALVFFILSLILFNFGKTNLISSFLKEEVVFRSVFGQKDFKLSEDLKFEFSYEYKNRNTFLAELISHFNGEKNINIKSEITSLRGERIENYNFEIEYLEQEKFSFKLFPIENDFKPGKYSLKVIAEKNGQILGTQEKEFTWGVLAINFNKSIYTLEDERAYIQMAALNDKGNTICNADLEMTIISPEGNIEHFSTDDGNIEYSGECKGDSYVEVPDYFAYYKLPYSQGEYMVELTAYTYNGTRTIVDFFQVRESVPFEIERIGPTRIYPPADYEIKIIVKANQDFEGEIVETVPDSFSIFENEIPNSKFQIQDSNQNEKQIVWDVELKKGETYEFLYQFNAPNISPYLYLLGPLSFEKVLP